jgi:hypothetical protein
VCSDVACTSPQAGPDSVCSTVGGALRRRFGRIGSVVEVRVLGPTVHVNTTLVLDAVRLLRPVTLRGVGAPVLLCNAGPGAACMQACGGGAVSLSGLSIQPAIVPGPVSAVASPGPAVVASHGVMLSLLSSRLASHTCGCMFVSNVTLVATDSVFSECTVGPWCVPAPGTLAAPAGAAIRAVDGSTSLLRCRFLGCSAVDGTGGAVHASASAPFNVKSSLLTVVGCNFTRCSARDGGVLALSGSTLSVSLSSFVDGAANSTAGCLLLTGASVATVTASSFLGCSAGAQALLQAGTSSSQIAGGALLSSLFSRLNVTACSFTSCVSGGTGGGVHADVVGGLSVSRCSFVNCTAGYHGGSLLLSHVSGEGLMINCTVAGSRSLYGSGGGVAWLPVAPTLASPVALRISNSRISGQALRGGGGALFVASSAALPVDPVLVNVTFPTSRALYGDTVATLVAEVQAANSSDGSHVPLPFPNISIPVFDAGPAARLLAGSGRRTQVTDGSSTVILPLAFARVVPLASDLSPSFLQLRFVDRWGSLVTAADLDGSTCAVTAFNITSGAQLPLFHPEIPKSGISQGVLRVWPFRIDVPDGVSVLLKVGVCVRVPR